MQSAMNFLFISWAIYVSAFQSNSFQVWKPTAWRYRITHSRLTFTKNGQEFLSYCATCGRWGNAIPILRTRVPVYPVEWEVMLHKHTKLHTTHAQYTNSVLLRLIKQKYGDAWNGAIGHDITRTEGSDWPNHVTTWCCQTCYSGTPPTE